MVWEVEIAVGLSHSAPSPLPSSNPSLKQFSQNKIQIVAATRLEVKTGEEMDVGGTVMGEEVAGKRSVRHRACRNAPSPPSKGL